MTARRTLITGASRGLGRALATELARRGDAVVATARDTDDLADLAVAAALRLDVTDPEQVQAALRHAGALDVVINNAGVTFTGPVEATPVPDVADVFDVNVLGPLRVARAALPAMRERRNGAILQISSVAGRVAPPLQGVYAASKAALERLSEAMRFEVSKFGIEVGIAVVGAVDTRAGVVRAHRHGTDVRAAGRAAARAARGARRPARRRRGGRVGNRRPAGPRRAAHAHARRRTARAGVRPPARRPAGPADDHRPRLVAPALV